MRPAAPLDKNLLLGMAVLTLVGFPLVGAAIVKLFTDLDISVMMRQTVSLPKQLGLGIGIGAVMGYLAHILTETKWVRPSASKYSSQIGKLDLNKVDMVLISICAGFGEELLFRGAVQLFFGIWPTAVLFVAIHGYLNPKDWRISIYGLLITIFIGLIGYMMEYWGIWAAIAAHAMVDLVLFLNMGDYKSSTS
jgi:membrane protease YdiL (CAAX protease family)